MNKKLSAVIAAFVAVVLGVCFTVSSFGFVKDNYGENQIQALAGMGLIDSKSPAAKVTRGEALIAIMVITGLDVYVEDYSPDDPCPYTDVSADIKPFAAVAYGSGVVVDMPYGLFRENDNITLEEMLHMTLEAYGLSVEMDSGIFNVAELCKIYKTCEADAFVFDLTYATYAEILWNLICTPNVYEENKIMGDLLVERGVIDPEAYEAAKGIMADYVFGQKHDYVTKALSWFDPSDESDTETSTVPEETTTTAPDTTTPVTSYDTEDNSGYSPPFKP